MKPNINYRATRRYDPVGDMVMMARSWAKLRVFYVRLFFVFQACVKDIGHPLLLLPCPRYARCLFL